MNTSTHKHDYTHISFIADKILLFLLDACLSIPWRMPHVCRYLVCWDPEKDRFNEIDLQCRWKFYPAILGTQTAQTNEDMPIVRPSPSLRSATVFVAITFTRRMINAQVVLFYVMFSLSIVQCPFFLTNFSSSDSSLCLHEHVTDWKSVSEYAPSIDPGCASDIVIVQLIRRRETYIVGKSNFASRNQIFESWISKFWRSSDSECFPNF